MNFINYSIEGSIIFLLKIKNIKSTGSSINRGNCRFDFFKFINHSMSYYFNQNKKF